MRNKRIELVFIYIVLVAVAVSILFPLYWTALVSMKSKIELMGKPTLYVTRFRTESYTIPFLKGSCGRFFLNSLIIASGNAVLVLLLATPATYALSRFKIRGERHIFFWLITNRMAPPAVFIIPLYLIFTGKVFGPIRLIDTHLGLILAYCFFNLPFAIWMLKGTMDAVPVELDEAALVDGCSHLRILLKIIVPVVKPTLAVTVILTWLFSWNEMLLATILTGKQAGTITVGLVQFVTLVGTDWAAMAAVTIVCLIPVCIFMIFVQRHIVSGLTFGAVEK